MASIIYYLDVSIHSIDSYSSTLQLLLIKEVSKTTSQTCTIRLLYLDVAHFLSSVLGSQLIYNYPNNYYPSQLLDVVARISLL